MSVILYQFQTVKFIQMMSLTFGLFTQVSGSGPLGPLVVFRFTTIMTIEYFLSMCLLYIKKMILAGANCAPLGT